MGIVETILCLLAAKCAFNFVPFLCLREVHNQSSLISLLILMVTDTMITGFLLCLWIGGWIVSPNIEVIFLRFLGFQNQTYKLIPLLLPWVCFGEEWSRSHRNQRGGPAKAEDTLSMQSRLLGLTCWLIAACFSHYPSLSISNSPPVCETWDWRCPFQYIQDDRDYDLLIPAIGIALGSTLFCSTMESKCSIARKILAKRQPVKKLVMSTLLVGGAVVSLILLPPFIAISSWFIVALDRLSGLFRLQSTEPLITVHSVVENLQVKECTVRLYQEPAYSTDKKSLI